MTTYRWLRLSVVFILFLAPGTKSSAQQTPSPEGVIRINVNLVQVDAIVTDAKGKPVTNLTADDFEVLQDGMAQTITNFAFIEVKDAKINTPPSKSASKQAKNVVGPPPPPLALRPEQIRRTIALVVDDLALSADSTVRVRQSLKKWVDEEMQPGDLVAVLRTSAGMGALQQFTADKRVLYAAIDLVQFHTGRVGVSSFAPVTGAPLESALPGSNGEKTQVSTEIDTTAFNNEIQQSYMLGSIGAVRYVLQGLRDLPGRKSLVLFSENMKFTYLNIGSNLVNNEATSLGLADQRLERLIDEANRSSVVVYAIDPRGVVYTGLTAEDFTGAAGGTGEAMTPQQIAEIGTNRSNDLIASKDGMIYLTQKTGGLFLANNDIQGSLKQVVDDGDGYYLLGYQPGASTFEGGRSKFHTIRVRVKRPGLQVRSRTGFFGTPDAEAAPAPVGRVAQIAKAMASPFSSGAVRVRLTTLFSHSEKEGPYINAMFHFDARDLKFTRVNDGAPQAQIDTFAVTFDADGRSVASTDKIWAIRVEDQDYEELLRRGLVYSLHLPVKQPGAYQMRIVLRDSNSEQIGSATQFIEVPDIAKGRLALSGLILAGEQARQTGASDLAEGAINGDPNLSPAVRVFKTGTVIHYAFEILNAHPDKNRKFQLDVQTRLFREGQQVFTGTAGAVNGDGQQDPKHLAVSGRMQLGQAVPGHYAVQVIVTDKLAKEKYRIAAQAMDFEVRE
jgi:VWFA-related protein